MSNPVVQPETHFRDALITAIVPSVNLLNRIDARGVLEARWNLIYKYLERSGSTWTQHDQWQHLLVPQECDKDTLG